MHYDWFCSRLTSWSSENKNWLYGFPHTQPNTYTSTVYMYCYNKILPVHPLPLHQLAATISSVQGVAKTGGKLEPSECRTVSYCRYSSLVSLCKRTFMYGNVHGCMCAAKDILFVSNWMMSIYTMHIQIQYDDMNQVIVNLWRLVADWLFVVRLFAWGYSGMGNGERV